MASDFTPSNAKKKPLYLLRKYFPDTLRRHPGARIFIRGPGEVSYRLAAQQQSSDLEAGQSGPAKTALERAEVSARALAEREPWKVDAHVWMIHTKGEEGRRATRSDLHLAPGEKKAIGKRGMAHMSRQWEQKTALYSKLKEEWQELVSAAFRSGKIAASTPGLSRDARDYVRGLEASVAAQKAAAEQKQAAKATHRSRIEVLRTNRVDIKDLRKGDKVYLYRVERGEADKDPRWVARKFAKSVHLATTKNGKPITDRSDKTWSFGAKDYLFGREQWPTNF